MNLKSFKAEARILRVSKNSTSESRFLQMLGFVGIACLLVVTPGALAQTSGVVSPACELKDSVNFEQFKAMIKSPNCNVRSIDDVIAKLPTKMKRNFSLYYKSKSLQGPHQVDYLNPRAILTTETTKFRTDSKDSPTSAFVVTFNGKPTQANYRNLEILQINAKAQDAKDVFQYFDVEFPSEETSNTESWEQIQSKIKFSAPNPSSCVSCHGSPARPIFAGYPIWEGSYGSFHLNRNKNEVEGYRQFMAKATSDPSSRYRHLQFNKVIEGLVDVDHSSILKGLKNVEINGMLQEANGFRVAKMVMQTPQYAQYKFALLGALMSRNDFNDFLPKATFQSLERNLERTYSLQANYTPEKIVQIMKKIGHNPNEQFGDIASLKHGSNAKTVEEVLSSLSHLADGSATMERLAVDTFQHQGYHRISRESVQLRFLMEGRGISLATWFMDLTQPTYRMNHGGTGAQAWSFALMQTDPALHSYYQKAQALPYGKTIPEFYRFCSQLKADSLSALENLGPAAATAPQIFRRTQADNTYPVMFAKTCAKCHEEEKVGPRIPFKDPAAFKAWVTNDHNFASISYKLQAREGESMPPTFKLSQQEIQDLLNYIDFARKK